MQLRKIKTRINSIEKIRQVTRAMKMVATVKLRRAQMRLTHFSPYAKMVMDVAARVAAVTDPMSHPLLQKTASERELYLIVTADRGLCGAANTNILRRVKPLIDAASEEPMFIVIGDRGHRFFENEHLSAHKTYMNFFDVLERKHA